MAKILIVDDDHEIVELLKEILLREGHEIDCAYETTQGMQKVRTFNPDLVILDYHMPGATGAHLFESLRRNQASRLTPVLFLSGEASPEDILNEVDDPQGSHFLPKPIPLNELRNTVSRILKESKNG